MRARSPTPPGPRHVWRWPGGRLRRGQPDHRSRSGARRPDARDASRLTTFSAVGDSIEYDYLLSNTGGVVLDVLPSPRARGRGLPIGAPAARRGRPLRGLLLITQDDIDAGSVINIAQAHGTYGAGEDVASEEASLSIAAVSERHIVACGAGTTTRSADGSDSQRRRA